MKEFVIAKCPSCEYYWNPRRIAVEDVKESVGNAMARLKMCPRCKIRFDRAGAKKPRVWDEQHDSYKALVAKLDIYNGIPSTTS